MDFLSAFSMSLFAGLSTGIGSLIALFVKNTDKRFLSFCLGLSAGVMLCVSSVELIPEALFTLADYYGRGMGTVITVLPFFSGLLVSAVINKSIPEINLSDSSKNGLMKTGIFTAIAVSIHNFPEGISTFMSSAAGMKTALPIVFAVAIHNIPEGISVSMPIYYATSSRKKSFLLSFLSGLTEPLGAAVAFVFLRPFLNEVTLCAVLSAVAGVMVYISSCELLPTSKGYGGNIFCFSGVLTGAAIMSASLVIL